MCRNSIPAVEDVSSNRYSLSTCHRIALSARRRDASRIHMIARSTTGVTRIKQSPGSLPAPRALCSRRWRGSACPATSAPPRRSPTAAAIFHRTVNSSFPSAPRRAPSVRRRTALCTTPADCKRKPVTSCRRGSSVRAATASTWTRSSAGRVMRWSAMIMSRVRCRVLSRRCPIIRPIRLPCPSTRRMTMTRVPARSRRLLPSNRIVLRALRSPPST